MAIPQISDIIEEVIIELAQVPGLNTQVYAAPRIRQFIQSASIMITDDHWWPQLRKYFYNVATDPLTGKLVADLTADLANHEIISYQDIEAVFPTGSNKQLRAMPSNQNPALLVNNTTNAFYIMPDMTIEKRPFKVIPVSATDTLTVIARQRPIIPSGDDDYTYLDRLMLTYAAAYMYAEDDGTNPGAIAKLKGLFETRRDQVLANWQEHSVPLDGRWGMSEYEWMEVP